MAVNYAHVFETTEEVVSPEEELSRDNGYVGHIPTNAIGPTGCNWPSTS
jgi:hypothetical protein